MMESLRNFLTGPRLIFIVLLCALPFVFLGTGSLGSGFGGSFGTINGEDVTENDLQLASNTAVQRFKSIYGEEFDFDMLSEEVRSESIKQELIVQKVLQAGARSLEKPLGGRGLLIGGAPGVNAGTVLILGGGVVGENAATIATGMQANVFIVDKSEARLTQLKSQFGESITTLLSDEIKLED